MAGPGDDEAYQELQGYTLLHGDPAFIHQHVVDAFAAQHASAEDKPIRVAFALVGLYLHLVRGASGREVQLAHMRLARRRRTWPRFDPPAERGEVTPTDVMAAAAGPDRDRAIDAWCRSVWSAWHASHERVARLLEEMDG